MDEAMQQILLSANANPDDANASLNQQALLHKNQEVESLLRLS